MNYNQLASIKSLSTARENLQKRGYTVFTLQDKQQALEKIKTLIPQGASVMNGSSVTLEQIGYVEYLSEGKHGWQDLHALVNAENDKQKRAQLRRESVLSEYYLGSVHALSETGDFVIASNTGSQLPHVVYTSSNLIFVVSTKKIVPTLEDALKRLEDHVVPLENEHMLELYNMPTALNKIVIFRGESAMIGRKVTFLLIEEDLGF